MSVAPQASASSSTPSDNWQLEAIFKEAIDKFNKEIDDDPAKPDDAVLKLGSCQSPDDFLVLLEEKAAKFKEYREGNRKLINFLKPIVKVIHAFSAVLIEATSLVPFQPARVICVCLDALLTASINVSSSYDALVELFECIGCFLKRLEIYSNLPPTPLMKEIITSIMTEFLSVLTLSAKQIKNRRWKKFAMALLGEKDIQAVLLRLDRLTREEGQRAIVEILGVVHSLMNNVTIAMNDGKVSMGSIFDTLEKIQQMETNLNKIADNQFQEKSRRWLCPPDPSRNYNNARALCLEGTNMWFFGDQEGHFDKWRESSSVLWVHGKPGSGKSILLSSIIEKIDRLRRSGLVWMAYFFFDAGDLEKQHRHGLLSSLVWQLSNSSEACRRVLYQTYSQHDEGQTEPSDDALWQCLTFMLRETAHRPPTYIILDAIDESPDVSGLPSEREKVLEFLENLVGLPDLPDLYLCVSSRFEENTLNNIPGRKLSISLHQEHGQNEDILTYIKKTVNSDRKMEMWTGDEKKLVVDTLSDKSDGMFSWACFQLDHVRRGQPSHIPHALERCPKTLDGVYRQALLRIDEEKQQFMRELFRCLTVSARPLRVEELAEVLAVYYDTGEAPFNTRKLTSDEEVGLFTCSSLVTINDGDGGSRVIQFVHPSIRQFLTSDSLAEAEQNLSYYHINALREHKTFAIACLEVLAQFDKDVSRDHVKSVPLASYAIQCVAYHCRQFENMPPLEDIYDCDDALYFLHQNSPRLSAGTWLCDVDTNVSCETTSTEQPKPRKKSSLFYAIYGGFIWFVKGLGRLAPNHPKGADSGGGLLIQAYKQGDIQLIRSLLQCGSDPNTLDIYGASVLHYASQMGDVDLVRYLLKHKADVNLQNAEGQTPLELSSTNNQFGVSELLVSNLGGANVNPRDNNGRTPLWKASHLGHLEAVQFLIKNGADIDSTDNYGWSPLQSAMSQNHRRVVAFLIDQGADFDRINTLGAEYTRAGIGRRVGMILPSYLHIPVEYFANRLYNMLGW